MSKGAGRLERSVIRTVDLFGWGKGEVSTEQICQSAYPEVEVIEKKHRVAVLQVLHRLISDPPRPMEERTWMVKPAKKRGFWRQVPIPGAKQPDTRSYIAYHEAGHALADLYLGHEIDKVAVLTWQQRRRQEKILARTSNTISYSVGFVLSKDIYDFPDTKALIRLLAGPIAEAHYKGKWPHVKREVSRTYSEFLVNPEMPTTDLARIRGILTKMDDDEAHQAAILRRVQDLTQALIRSKPGWHFIQLLSAKMLVLKHGSLGQRRTAAVFREAFGRPPPAGGAWDDHWPPSLTQFRAGWLPPEGS